MAVKSPSSIRRDTPHSTPSHELIPLPCPSLCLALKESSCRKCSKEQIYKYPLWVSIGCWPNQGTRIGSCYPGLGLRYLKRENIDKDDLRKTQMIPAFGLNLFRCLRRRAQIESTHFSPSYRAQLFFHSWEKYEYI